MLNINVVCPFVVLENELNEDIRRNDLKKFKILVDKDDNLVKINIKALETLKDSLKKELLSIIDSNKFHLEQVYTLGEEKYYFDDSIDIIYLGITNFENVKNLDDNYKLIDFDISNNYITFGNSSYKFKTKEKISNNNIEYYHEIEVDDIKIEKKLLEVLIAYKHLRNKVDNSDIIFKFLGKTFSLEDVRIVYEKIKEISVDKSNFRKRIVKYCEETDVEVAKKGYRPSKLYTFKVLKGDIWI